MPNCGYLGGEDSTWEQRMPLIKRHLAGRARIYVGILNQCRCGTIERVLYRKRHYCPRCGRWSVLRTSKW